MYVINGDFVGSGHPAKVVYAADPTYSGPIRIRGGRIDGSGQLFFDSFDNRWEGASVKTVDGFKMAPELDLLESRSIFPNVPSGWRMWPTGTYGATPGCYAWQVDGRGFTEIITIHVLDLPTLSEHAACPVSPHQIAHNLSAEFGDGPAVGTGPIYALMGGMPAGALSYSESYKQAHPPDPYAYSKVLWMAKPGLDGTVLVRGRQIDGPSGGPNWIGFGMTEVPEFALQWDIASHSGWASQPSEIRIPAPGCYALQVDSHEGSQVIVFQVVGIP